MLQLGKWGIRHKLAFAKDGDTVGLRFKLT